MKVTRPLLDDIVVEQVMGEDRSPEQIMISIPYEERE